MYEHLESLLHSLRVLTALWRVLAHFGHALKLALNAKMRRYHTFISKVTGIYQ